MSSRISPKNERAPRLVALRRSGHAGGREPPSRRRPARDDPAHRRHALPELRAPYPGRAGAADAQRPREPVHRHRRTGLGRTRGARLAAVCRRRAGRIHAGAAQSRTGTARASARTRRDAAASRHRRPARHAGDDAGRHAILHRCAAGTGHRTADALRAMDHGDTGAALLRLAAAGQRRARPARTPRQHGRAGQPGAADGLRGELRQRAARQRPCLFRFGDDVRVPAAGGALVRRTGPRRSHQTAAHPGLGAAAHRPARKRGRSDGSLQRLARDRRCHRGAAGRRAGRRRSPARCHRRTRRIAAQRRSRSRRAA